MRRPKVARSFGLRPLDHAESAADRIGPGGWYDEAPEFGWTPGKQVHSTWLQNGAEEGLFGFAIYLAFYLICIAQMAGMAWTPTQDDQSGSFSSLGADGGDFAYWVCSGRLNL